MQIWTSDGPEYLDIARALASGQGFVKYVGFWPGHPTIVRAPLWPFIVSLALRVYGDHPYFILRLVGAAVQAATAFGVALLTFVLSGSRRRMMLAGVVTALLPEAHTYMGEGISEPCSAAVLVIGTLLLCLGERYFFGGVVMLSLLPLVRPNFILLPVGIVLAAAILTSRSHCPAVVGNKRRILAAILLFYAPITVWTIRNYRVTGGFPVLGGTGGEAFYGTYNPVTATPGPYFGKWVHPDAVPGEERERQLALRMSEFETLHYYHAKAKRFIADHWTMMPMLIITHAVRVMLPDPRGGWHKYFDWFLRMMLYAAAIMIFWRRKFRLESWLGLVVAGTALATAATVLLYSSGDNRYVYQLTFLLLPLAFGTLFNLTLQRESR